MTFIDSDILYVRFRTHARFVYLHCFKHFTVRRFSIGIVYIFGKYAQFCYALIG